MKVTPIEDIYKYKQLLEKEGDTMEHEEKCKIERYLWRAIGMREHNHQKDDLRAVSKKMKNIGLVPYGYHYPELNRKSDRPEAMKKMLARKTVHNLLNN